MENEVRMLIEVHNTLQLRQALAAGYAAADLVIPETDSASALDRARQEGFAAGMAERLSAVADGINPEVVAEIAARERTRIFEIQAITERGFENVARKAIADGLTAERFALLQAQERVDRGITLSAIRQDAPKAAQFAGVPPMSGAPGNVQSHARNGLNPDAIFAKRKQTQAGK